MPTILNSGPLDAFSFEALTISTIAMVLTPAVYTDAAVSNPLGASAFSASNVFLTVEGAPIRVRWDGPAPTAAVGHLLNIGDILILDGTQNIRSMKMIRQGAVDGVVSVSYSR